MSYLWKRQAYPGEPQRQRRQIQDGTSEFSLTADRMRSMLTASADSDLSIKHLDLTPMETYNKNYGKNHYQKHQKTMGKTQFVRGEIHNFDWAMFNSYVTVITSG